MKLNDIVEHTKGRRAKIYSRKPKNTIEPHKPQAPVGPMSEAEVTLKPLAGAQEVDVDGKAVGTATTPQAATAISDLAKKGEFTPATADNQQPAAMEDEVGTPYYVKLTGNGPVVKSGNGFTPIVASKIWDTMTPEIEEKARTQGFRKITLSVNGAMIPALEGGGKVIVGKSSYGTIANSQNEEHNHHGVDAHGDVGGDATDSFLDQIKLQPEDDIGHGISEMSRIRHLAGLKEADAPAAAPAPAPTTTAIVPASDVDPSETALKSAQVDPELMQQVEANTVRDAEGDVDLSATFQKIADQIPAEPQIRAEWAEAFKQFDEKFSHIEQDPEFMKMTPEEQVKCKQDVQEVRALFQKFMEFAVQMSNTVKSGAQQVRTAMAAPGAQNPLKGVKTLTPPVQETADDQLLKQMLSIAGLR